MNSRLPLLVAAALAWAPALGQGVGRPDLLWVSAGHTGGVISAAFSPGGDLLATAGFGDGTIKLWDAPTGGFIRTIGDSITEMHQVLFTPDGKFLVGVSDWLPGGEEGEYKLWRIADGTLVHSFGGNGASGTISVGSVALSPDGAVLATGYHYDQTRLWRTSDGALLNTIDGAGNAVAFTPDGSKLIVHPFDFNPPYGVLQVWDTATWTLDLTIDAKGDNGLDFWSVALSPDGRTIATGYNNTSHSVRLWNVADGSLVRTLDTVDHYSAGALAYSPDGKELTVAGSEDQGGLHQHLAFVFNPEDGALIRTFATNVAATFTLAYSPDGKAIVAAGADDYTHLFDTASGQPVRDFGIRRGQVMDLAFSADSVFLAAGNGANETFDGGDIEIFRSLSGLRLVKCHGHQDVVNGIAFAPAGDVLASGSGSPPPDTIDPTVRLWSVADGTNLWIAPGHEGGTTSVAVTLDGQKIASGGRDNLIKIWDRNTGSLIKSLAGHTNWVRDLAISPDGSILASAGDITIRLWRTSDWSFIRAIGNDDWPVNSVAFSPDGSAVAIGGDSYGQNLRLSRVTDGSVLRLFDGDPRDFMGHVAFTPDGRYILSSSQGYPPRVWIWDVNDGAVATFYEQEVGWRHGPGLAVSPDGKLLGIGRVDATVEVAANPFGPPVCYADFTGDGALDLFDFLAYVNTFNAGDPAADCTGDGVLDLFAFLCFVNAFNAGC